MMHPSIACMRSWSDAARRRAAWERFEALQAEAEADIARQKREARETLDRMGFTEAAIESAIIEVCWEPSPSLRRRLENARPLR